jgi:integrase
MEQRSKRRSKGLGSLIKLKNSSMWHARFYDLAGRKISMSTGTAIKMEAEDFLRDEMDKVRNKGLTPVSDMRKIRYADLRAGLLANYTEKGNKSLLTCADGSETIMGLSQLDRFFGYDEKNPGPSVIQLGTDVARDFVKQRQEEGAGNAVINRSLSALRRMLRVAYEDKKISAVPVIRLQKEPAARKGFVELSQFECLVKALPTHLRPYVTFLYHCGGRSGEAKLVEWRQIDLDRRLVRLEEDQTKGDTARVVPLPSVLVMMLNEIEPKTGLVFSTVNLRKEWMTACAACGLGRKIEIEGKPHDPRYEGLTLHDLRRSAARNLLNAGVPETVIMKIGGWKTRSVFDRYAVSSTADLTAAMQLWETSSQSLLSQGKGYSLGKVARLALPQKSIKPHKH